MRRCFQLAGLVVALQLVAPLRAQTPTIFRVYSNLVQVPVLVTAHLIDPVDQLHFAVSLDSGPPFPIAHVRLEGDDPIALSILIDLTGDQTTSLDRLDKAIAALAPRSLTPRDTVSIYAFDCDLVRTANNLPAETSALRRAASAVLRSAAAHGADRSTPTCRNYRRLWDNLAYLADQLSQRPGHRVILAITPGDDNDSKHDWVFLKDFANLNAVAIFGLSPSEARASSGGEPPFRLLCASTGGEVFTSSPHRTPETLAYFVQIVRSRYIVQFPRPDTLSRGLHGLRIDITRGNGFSVPQTFIRSTGIAVPIADAATLADPNTIRNDPADAPTVGARRILAPQK